MKATNKQIENSAKKLRALFNEYSQVELAAVKKLIKDECGFSPTDSLISKVWKKAFIKGG